jgi:signal transduction histidine kinase/DNA-binding response OmpR family regulator/CHASE3 domain sensor protein
MPSSITIDKANFRRILSRNVMLPLGAGILAAVVFVAFLVYLVTTLELVDHTNKAIGYANEISGLVAEEQSAMRGYLLSGDQSYLLPFHTARPKLAVAIPSLANFVADNPIQVTRIQRVAELHKRWEDFSVQTIASKRVNSEVPAERLSGAKYEFEQINSELADFTMHEQALLKTRNSDARNVSYFGGGLFVLFSLLLSAVLASFGRGELMRLSKMYSDVLEQRTTQADILEQQAWQRIGQTELLEKSIAQPSVPEFGQVLLEFLSVYVNAVIGALYVRDESGTLHRVATHGFAKESTGAAQSFSMGDSLVGQAAQSQRVIQLENVPEAYLKVASGIGYSAPRHVLLLPIEQSHDAYGVIELGFMQAVTPRELEFLNLIAPRIGATVEILLSRVRLENALSETQQLNEELQAQQEELRAANEELEEQSRTLEHSQSDLELQKAELEKTNRILAQQASSLDHKNRALNAAQSELEQRAQELQKASKYKSEFLANMSHELRTPLNSSLILSKLLADNPSGNLSKDQVKYAQTIYSAGNDLLNLINDILDLAKVEAGKLDIHVQEISVGGLLKHLREIFEPMAQKKHLDLRIEVVGDAPESIRSDRQRLEQILKNLLSNAIKFTEHGSVTLRVAAGMDEGIEFTVEDTGIGIPESQWELVFEAFKQADGTTSRKYGGTGLGLSISRELAHLLQGSIRVQSQVDVGSEFALQLPLSLGDDDENVPLPFEDVLGTDLARWQSNSDMLLETPLKTQLEKPLQQLIDRNEQAEQTAITSPTFADDRVHETMFPRTVLVVEDDHEFARILYELAHEMGYRCLVAMTASEGVSLAVEFLPDAILLDIKLPDASGMSVLQKLKEISTTRHIPIHIVSATDRVQIALEQGAIGYIMKPTSREQLGQVFTTLESKFTQKNKRVLLVEDDERQRESVKALIAADNVEIIAVDNGDDALRLLKESIFDCMIVDLKLPDIQGHELLEQMSNERVFSFPPVIVYTGQSLTRKEEAELQKYARSIIIKGARSPERLLDEVTLFLHKVESELPTERQAMLRHVRARDRALEGRKILVVDDDVRNIFALTSAIEHKGAEVEIARDGVEALQKIEALNDIDLVLMDVMMPNMDGLEATRRIRLMGANEPRFQKLPIIGITAKAMRDDQEQCLSAGMSDYLAKPLDLDRLYSLLRVWVPQT